jgi:hypothetical protein
VCTLLVVIYFSASAQLVSSDLFCYSGGAVEEAALEERVLRERANATSKISAAGRLKYDIRLPESGTDRDL